MTSTIEFDCKLAHCDEIKRVSNFKSIKELFDEIAKLFQIPQDEILYCTLNTHNFRDMDAILSNYLSYGDTIVVHVCGQSKELNLKKTQEYLGLTITDNGQGRAFVKKVKSNQQVVEDCIKQGDHIAAINSESTIGMRHFEVAKAIRELPKETNFTIKLIEPKYSEEYLKLKEVINSSEMLMQVPPLNEVECGEKIPNAEYTPNDLNCDNLLYLSLPIDQLLSKRSSQIDNHQASGVESTKAFGSEHDRYKTTIEKIDSMLESFLGINDNLLAIQIYRLARENKDSYAQFLDAMQASELSAFSFDDDMKNYLWCCATSRVIS